MTQHVDRQGVALVQFAVHEAQWIFREHKEVDHGIDAHIESTIGDEVTGRMVALQIKTGPAYFKEANEEGFVFRGDPRHLDYWLEHSLPVLLVLVDLAEKNIYWVHVTQTNIKSTGKGWKILVPRKNLLNSSALSELTKIALNLRISRPYSRLNLDDTSNGIAKRYTAQILLNADFPKDFIKNLVAEITKEVMLETWMSSKQRAERFAGRPADVVSLFLCRTLEDAKQGNWLCRSQWISPTLSPKARPFPLVMTVAPGEIAIDWTHDRDTMEQFALERQISKGVAVSTIGVSIRRLVTHLDTYRPLIEAFITNPKVSHQSVRLLRAEAKVAREHYLDAGEIGIPPLELSDLMDAFHSVITSYDNAFMVFEEELIDDSAVQRAAHLAADYLRAFDQDLSDFQLEAKRRNINT